MKRYFLIISLILVLLFLTKIIGMNELSFFIHPRYFWLVYSSVFVLFLIIPLIHVPKKPSKVSYFELGVLWIFLLFGLLFPFRPLSNISSAQNIFIINGSDASEIQRNKRSTDFVVDTKKRGIEDWVAIFSADPEPDRYQGQEVLVEGMFDLDAAGFPVISRYMVSCCAADARKLSIYLDSHPKIPAESWVKIKGEFIAAKVANERMPVIKVLEFTPISIPDNPYVSG